MSQKLITLPISDELYEQVQKIAEVSARSPEEVLIESLNNAIQIGTDLPALEALTDYPTVQLWNVVLNDISDAKAQRLHDLSEKNKWGALTSAEEEEIDQLVDLTNRYVLLRSQALVLLQERGENISHYLNASA